MGTESEIIFCMVAQSAFNASTVLSAKEMQPSHVQTVDGVDQNHNVKVNYLTGSQAWCIRTVGGALASSLAPFEK